ncbi:MAG: PAS domain S-box protein, partial [Anaerolineales bacterium]|nr:PAS domain S-box protein [Anaerolineales bacterium]
MKSNKRKPNKEVPAQTVQPPDPNEWIRKLERAEAQAGIGSWEFDVATGQGWWSRQMHAFFGSEVAGGVPDVETYLSYLHPDDRHILQSTLDAMARGTEPERLNFRTNPERGAMRVLSPNYRLEKDENGHPLRFSGTLQDITGQVQAERNLAQMTRLYATLSQVNQAIVRTKGPDELFQAICDAAVTFGELSLVWVGLLDKSSGDIRPVAANGADVNNWPFPTINIHSGSWVNGLVATAIRTSQVVVSENLQGDKRLPGMQGLFETHGYFASAVVPFRLKGRVHGVLGMISHEAGLFKTEQELRLLEEMGMDISFALEMMETEKLKSQWADAFEHSAHGMVIGDAKTNRIRACNPAFARQQGTTLQELIGMPVIGMYRPEDHERIKQMIAQADREGKVQFEAVKVRKDGSTYPMQLDVVSVRDTNGNLLYRVASQQDITERKQAEKKLEKQNLRLKTLREIDTAILASDSVENIVGAALDHIRELLDCERANLALIDWEKNEAVNFDVRDTKASAISKGARVSLDLIQNILHILSQNQPVLIKDLTLLPDPPPQIKIFIQEGLRSRCILPLFSQAKLIGSFTLSSTIPDFFDEEKVNLGREVANQVAIAITQKRLVENLREGEDRLAGIIHSAMDGIISVDANQNIILTNSASEKMFGYTSEEMIGRPLDMLIPASLRAAHRGHLEQFGSLGETSRSMHSLGEVKGLRANGEEFPIEASISQIEVAGRKILTVIHRDVTERKQAEAQIEYQADLLKRINDAVIAVDSQFHITAWNHAAETMYGWTAEEALGNLSTNVIRSEMTAEERQESLRQLRELGMYRNEIIQYRKDGQPIYVEASTITLYDKDKQITGLLSVNRDITERRKIEEERAEIHNRLTRITTHIPGFVFQFLMTSDGRFSVPYASTGIRDLYEVSPEQVQNDANAIFNLVHPEDADRVRKKIMESAEKLIPWHEENRVILPSGKTKWVEGHSSPHKEKDGSIVWYGFTQDITERKQTEGKLRESQELFRMLFHLSPVAYSLARMSDDKIVDINPACENLFGYTKNEVVGRRAMDLDHWMDKNELQNATELFKRDGRLHDFEIVYKTKSGTVGRAITYANLVEQAEETYLLSSFVNITERKQAEEALTQRLTELELLYQSGLALSGELDAKQVAGKLIEALEGNLDWHHVAIRSYDPESDRLELLAFNQPNLENEAQKQSLEGRINELVSNSTQGLSGWVVQHGQTVRSGDVRT